MTHLNDLSRIYKDSIAEKKDDSYLETDMKKRQKNNEKARKDMEKMGTSMKNPHFEEKQLDPVGREDADIDNDGDTDKSDKYLHKRRKAIAKAMKKRMSEGVRDLDPEKGTAERKARLEKKRGMKLDDHPEYKKEDVEVPSGDLKKLVKKAVKRVDSDVDGDVDHNDPKAGKFGEFVPSADGKKRITTSMGESFSNWRQDLSEVMGEGETEKKFKEKKVNNKIKINPKLGESVEEIGGTLLEETEVDEFDYVVESVYEELIEEGFSEDDVEFGIESALNTLDEGYYDSAVKASKDAAAKIKGETPKKSLKDRVKSAAKKAIMGTARAVGKVAKAKAAVQAAPGKAKSAMQAKVDKVKRIASAGYKSGRGPVEKKSTAYRGAGVGRKEKIGEEVVDEAVYGGEPEKKKDTRMTVTAADKKANTPAYQKFKAGDKRYKAAGHMGEEASMSPQELQLQKKKARIDRMIAMKRAQQLSKTKAGGDTPAKVMGEETEDSLRDKRMERGGVDGNVRYDKAPKFAPGPKKKSSGSDKAIDFVRKEITAKYGKGALIDTKKK